MKKNKEYTKSTLRQILELCIQAGVNVLKEKIVKDKSKCREEPQNYSRPGNKGLTKAELRLRGQYSTQLPFYVYV